MSSWRSGTRVTCRSSSGRGVQINLLCVVIAITACLIFHSESVLCAGTGGLLVLCATRGPPVDEEELHDEYHHNSRDDGSKYQGDEQCGNNWACNCKKCMTL